MTGTSQTLIDKIGISVIIPLKNRSYVFDDNGKEIVLFPRCAYSLIDTITEDFELEIVVSDFESEDIDLDEFKSLIEGRAKALGKNLSFKIVRMTGLFSRGLALNKALAVTSYDNVFTLDADCVTTEAFWGLAKEQIELSNIYYPIPWIYEDPEHRTGKWMVGSYGMVIFNKTLLKAPDPYLVFYHYGYEDNAFFNLLRELAPIKRKNCKELLHNWHPDELRTKFAGQLNKEEIPKYERLYARHKIRGEN